MILTARKHVNVRIGVPSVNAPNPSFLLAGQNVTVKSRVIGDNVDGNTNWILTDKNSFLSEEGFHITEEAKSLPFFSHLENVPQIFKTLNISQLWNFSKGEKINMGIIDSGVANHPSIKCKITELNKNVKVSTDLNGHGTTMACIISSLDEKEGKIGIAPMLQNIFSYTIDIDTIGPVEIIAAMDEMLNAKVNILNLSFCSNEASFFKPRPDAIKLQNKINELSNSGCVVVCATGNNHRRNQDFYPAKYDNVISVGGFDAFGNLDIDSNLWNGVSISMSSNNYFSDSQFEHSNGTSGAAAITSGCIACIYNSLLGANKTAMIKSIFSKMQSIKVDFDQTEISIPKFNTPHFIRLINS